MRWCGWWGGGGGGEEGKKKRKERDSVSVQTDHVAATQLISHAHTERVIGGVDSGGAVK